LALRALGAGWRVCFLQFCKGQPSAELEMLRKAGGERFTLLRFGTDRFIVGEPSEADRAEARCGLKAAREAVSGGAYDLVVLDEVNLAIHFKLFEIPELLALLDARPDSVELVLTGRRAAPELLARADLVTEMREVKHYYAQGVPARRGIEF
jgi:cob(I)alamin adenosyltransferase